MEVKGLIDYFNESLNVNCDMFAMRIIEGIIKEAELCKDKTDLIDEIIARFGALLSTFIETAQDSSKNKNTHELSGFLAALKFRYVDTINQKKGI